MKTNLDTNTETITPEIARKYLLSNVSNRKLNQSWVKFLVSEIKEGRWQLNGETIIFSDTGELLDGQHRLHAIAISGIAVPSLVTRGAHSNTWGTINITKARTPANALQREGFTNATRIAAVCRRLMVYKANIESGRVGDMKTRLSSSRVLEYASERLNIIDAVLAAMPATRTKSVPEAVIGAWYFIASNTPGVGPLRDETLRTLVTGVPGYEGDPVLAIREKGIRLTVAERSNADVVAQIMHTMIHAWNLRLQKKTAVNIRWRDEIVLARNFNIDLI
jgi:hypothetical protein